MASSISQRRQVALKEDLNHANGHVNGHTIHSAAPLKGQQPTLISYDDLPAWYQDNEYIRRGYRPVSNSIPSCFRSWIYVHHETFNIYSHLLSAVGFLAAQGFISSLISRKFPEATTGDRIIFGFFLLTAAITLTLSFSYHTLMNHSMRVSHLWLRIDYAGIICLTLGDFVSGIYLCFYCEPALRKIYWCMVRPVI